MADLSDKLKMGIITLGVVLLSYAPLNAQKHETDWLEKTNMSYCISKKGIKGKYDPSENTKEDNYCVSKAAKRYNKHFPKKKEKEAVIIPNDHKRYHKYYHKLIKKRLR